MASKKTEMNYYLGQELGRALKLNLKLAINLPQTCLRLKDEMLTQKWAKKLYFKILRSLL